MRRIININEGWEFIKEDNFSTVDLPHTWNGTDGQGGSDGYYRGRCVYKKKLPKYNGRVFIEINGANTVCDVTVNMNFAGRHENGYSMFRYDITDFLTDEENLIKIAVDNSPNDMIYPQMADFTFYGGLYRDVNIICEVADSHFALTDKSNCGIYITPTANGKVFVKSNVEGVVDGLTKEFIVTDAQGNAVASSSCEAAKDVVKMQVESPVLWNGRENPYLYTLTANLKKGDEIIDSVTERFGFRRFYFDANRGFFLNGEHLKLKGVSRHQDRLDIGNALTLEHHAEDIEIIKEIGANSVRLAHYQHDAKFYDLCDENGILVWAEIPVISKFSKKKQPQAKKMLEELIKQNYNHPSIFCWGIQNEISIASVSPSLISAINELNDIAHKLDSTRPTACAQLCLCSAGSKLNEITDILGYNNYFGWYFQTADEINNWLDDFHSERPQTCLCLSEYGAEGITTLHSAVPEQGDYSEEYQALFHEKYIKAINDREWLWGSYVWNMFDFGSSVRNEGGVRGRNNKGLVTIDRKTKKDAFYVYKANWSDEKFVHIAGERFVNRLVGEQEIKVYSNCDNVTLSVNGDASSLNGNKYFVFKAVIKEGKNVIKAKSGKCVHKIVVNGVAEPDESYSLGKDGSSFVRNWFSPDSDIDPDHLSLNDDIGTILNNSEVKKMIKNHLGKEIKLPAADISGKIPLKPVASLASKTKLGNKYVSLANQFLQTVEKDKTTPNNTK